MSNVNAPYGFKPIKSPAGNVSANPYLVSNSAAIFEGDLVTLNTAGFCVRATSVNGPFLGVAASSLAAQTTGTQAQLLVYDDPGQIFSAQYAGTSTANQTIVAQRHIPVIAAGSVALQLSQSSVSATTSAAAPLYITGFDPAVDNVPLAARPRIQVKILDHLLNLN
jgi:hypothetical protein